MTSNKVTRRDFLKIAGATCGGSVLACLGLGYAASRLIEIGVPELKTSESTFGEDGDTTMRVLIAHATYAGSTLEIAEVVAQELGARGFHVDVKPMSDEIQLDSYPMVILASAIQYGAWLPQAIDFVKTQQDELVGKRVALMSVHIQNLGNDEASRAACLAYLDTVRPYLKTEEEIFFAGRFDKYGAALLLPKLIAWAMPVLDLRDWTKIRAWAKTVFASKNKTKQ
jgi:menaquinone-dependent protoporphyrinogen oxidase